MNRFNLNAYLGPSHTHAREEEAGCLGVKMAPRIGCPERIHEDCILSMGRAHVPSLYHFLGCMSSALAGEPQTAGEKDLRGCSPPGFS